MQAFLAQLSLLFPHRRGIHHCFVLHCHSMNPYFGCILHVGVASSPDDPLQIRFDDWSYSLYFDLHFEERLKFQLLQILLQLPVLPNGVTKLVRQNCRLVLILTLLLQVFPNFPYLMVPNFRLVQVDFPLLHFPRRAVCIFVSHSLE